MWFVIFTFTFILHYFNCSFIKSFFENNVNNKLLQTQKRMNIHLLEDELEEKSRIPVLAKKSPRKNKKSKEFETN